MAAILETRVTVTQHGFHVKQPLQAAGGEGGAPAADAQLWREDSRREEGTSLSALSFASLPAPPAALTPPAPQPPACLQPAEHAHLTSGAKRLMRSVVRGLKAEQEPEAATEGLGGTYFFANEAGQKIAIMKPCDEEPLAPNNPKGFVGRQLGEPGLKPTVRVGEAASREVAAYLLDHGRFARVPHTVMVRMQHTVFHHASAAEPPSPKLGSLQQFVPHECDTSEMGASRFSVCDVQRIGIFDIRLFNTDRHAGNMLVRRPRPPPGEPSAASAFLDRSTYELIPIDHGFALPEALEPPYFEWQHWPQAMLPFGREELEYIAALDAKADIRMLRAEVPSLRVESLRVLEVCTTLLKECAAAGLTLTEIAGVVTRPLIGMEEEPSELERICFNARAEVEEWSESEDDAVAIIEEGVESEEEGVVAMLSMEEEGEEPCSQLASPTSTASSDNTAFKLSAADRSHTASSETSRLEDALFSMDEDATGNRTPPRARSPDAVPLSARLPPSRFATEAAAAKGGAAPVTPAAGKGLAVSFVSPLAAGAEDSLPASFDSLALQDSPEPPSSSMAATSMAASSTFGGATSYAPTSRCGPGATAGAGGRPRKTRSRRKLAIGSRLLKLTTQTYPPLVESRAAGAPSMSALAVFRDLTEEQWERFMGVVQCQVQRKLRDGVWKSAAAAKAPPMMSCPRF
ncbi:phosphatidylinositol 4-kinase gamma 7-like isoform B [Micractinium conductrix]|uniref:1-phosphatidylinositol 4-kinase n=1 Tax=Micractinium conductrix TaxID=554055 RepID=A0A2P6V8P7_9CHLO|nr:phosphatidylinositol 4-kinase gamma 7-like isoform A [Micractinium conductrix]PSC70454.1 phosphatidylinositol 4-kinase gamma 7-like isoform B [Micractinium conductrix]|eukprot:PSC70453.1 phosphatidylinositol 4-kinase gamma 7-like isoform A [Micractinium conductrix]